MIDDKLAYPTITESQRNCLSHVLRNAYQIMEGLLFLIEDRSSSPSAKELLHITRELEKHIVSIRKTFEHNSFCSLRGPECQSVAHFVGCDGQSKRPF